MAKKYKYSYYVFDTKKDYDLFLELIVLENMTAMIGMKYIISSVLNLTQMKSIKENYWEPKLNIFD